MDHDLVPRVFLRFRKFNWFYFELSLALKVIFVSSSWPLRLVWGLFYDTQSKCSIQTITVSHLREPQGSCWGKDTRKAFVLTHIFILNQTIHFCTPKVLQFASVLRWGGFKLEIGTSSFIISYLSTWPQHRNIE